MAKAAAVLSTYCLLAAWYLVAGLLLNVTEVNLPVPGVVAPILTLFIEPTDELVSVMVPPLTDNAPFTVNAVNVPTDVSVLEVIVEPKPVCVNSGIPLLLRVPVNNTLTVLTTLVASDDVARLPVVSTLNPGLVKP